MVHLSSHIMNAFVTVAGKQKGFFERKNFILPSADTREGVCRGGG